VPTSSSRSRSRLNLNQSLWEILQVVSTASILRSVKQTALLAPVGEFGGVVGHEQRASGARKAFPG
jgi:hypothetical protein